MNPFGALMVPTVSVSAELTVIVATNEVSSGSTAIVDVPVPGSIVTDDTPIFANVTSEKVPLSLWIVVCPLPASSRCISSPLFVPLTTILSLPPPPLNVSGSAAPPELMSTVSASCSLPASIVRLVMPEARPIELPFTVSVTLLEVIVTVIGHGIGTPVATQSDVTSTVCGFVFAPAM